MEISEQEFGELMAHCYRMLGSVQDAEDALQNALLGAWQGLSGFEGRGSIRSWLYRIATNACLGLVRRKRVLVSGPAFSQVHDLGEPVLEPVWLEPYPEELLADLADPGSRYELRESVELASPRCSPAGHPAGRADPPRGAGVLRRRGRHSADSRPARRGRPIRYAAAARWFHGLAGIEQFFTVRVFETPGGWSRRPPAVSWPSRAIRPNRTASSASAP